MPSTNGGDQPAARKILVVDDHESQRRLMELTFEQGACEVLSAADGHAAVELERRHRPQWIFMDWQMPGLTGIEACQQMRQAGSRAIIVIITGRDLPDDRHAALKAGASHVLGKPVLPQELLSLAGLAQTLP